MIKSDDYYQTDRNLSNVKPDYLKGTFLDIYSDYDAQIHIGKYFTHLYNELPHYYKIYVNINLQRFLQKISEVYNLTDKNYLLKEEQSNNKKIDKIDYASSGYLIELKPGILLDISSFKATIAYGQSIDFEEIKKLISYVDENQKKKKHNRKFYMISSNRHSEYGYEFKKFNIKKQEIDISNNYNDDFLPVHDTVFDFLKAENKNGLILLHGKYGTGKTTYIRYIMSQINRRFIFLPVSMMDAVSSPNFLPFISRYKNSVIVLEDCEEMLIPRNQGVVTNNSLVTLLNLSDGLLADALSFKIICTFNTNIKHIDQAILRKGRLVARYEFNELKISKVQNLWEKLGYDGNAPGEMNLAEIYNKNSNNFNNTVSPKKMGFN